MTVSREYYDETKNWLEAQWQEGVPVMDADLNAAQRIRQMWIRRMITELLGNGSPNDGFKLSGNVTDPMIHAGDIYVTGLRIVQDAAIAASAQPNAPVTFPSGDGIWYLDVQLVLITNVEDPDLRDSRLPGTVETPIKMWKIDWTLQKESGSSLPVPPSTHIFIGIAQETGGVFTDIRNDGMLAAGEDTGFQNTEGDRPGSGHTHHDEDIVVDSPDYSGENLEEVLGEIDSRIEVVESGVGTVTPDVNGNETVAEHFADETIHRRNHNDMESIQGGVADERFHIELDLYEAATGASGANAGNPFATVGDLTGVAAKFSIPVQTVQELRDVSTGDRSDKQVRLVEDKGSLYRFDETGTGTDDGDGIITPTSGTGRWFRISSAVPDLSTVLAKGNSAGGQRITSLQNPTSASDAATKDYVDNEIAGIDVAKYKYPDILGDAAGSGDATDIPSAFGLIPVGADRHMALRRGDYALTSDQNYNIGGLLWTGAGEASRIYGSGGRKILTLSAGDNKIVKITGFFFDDVTLVVNGAKEVHIAECVFENCDLYIGTNSEPVEWAVVENNRFIESEIFYPGTAGNVDHITVKNNYFKRTGTVQSGIIDIWWNPEEVYILDNVIDVSGVTNKNVNSSWYYVINVNTQRNGVIRGNTIIMPESNPADRVVGIDATGDVNCVWIIEGNKFISNLIRDTFSSGHCGMSLFDSDTNGPYFILSGNYFIDFNVNQGTSFDKDFPIAGSGSYPGNIVVRNNIHKNCNGPYYPQTGMNVSGDVTY